MGRKILLRLIAIGASLAVSIAISSIAAAEAGDSYLFGHSATEAFGSPEISKSAFYLSASSALLASGYVALKDDFGSPLPAPLKILIKDDTMASPFTQAYLDALSNEKSALMAIYQLSNSDYNRLAAIAFGIFGRETKLGMSLKLYAKEIYQDQVTQAKLAKKKWADYLEAARTHDPSKFLAPETWTVPRNSRGLTQIKKVPSSIAHYYCVNEDQLIYPRVAAVATVGFLAESLKTLRNRVRNQWLSYITNENLFDYVLYVYFGRVSQLTTPIYDPATGQIKNEIATPERNLYVQTVHRYMQGLALYEKQTTLLQTHSDSACRLPADP